MRIKRYNGIADGHVGAPEYSDWDGDPASVEWLRQYDRIRGFHRFSVSDGRYLMAEYWGGYEWWVCGIVDGDCDLPAWQPMGETRIGDNLQRVLREVHRPGPWGANTGYYHRCFLGDLLTLLERRPKLFEKQNDPQAGEMQP